jgi:signal transduction histidine kinase
VNTAHRGRPTRSIQRRITTLVVAAILATTGLVAAAFWNDLRLLDGQVDAHRMGTGVHVAGHFTERVQEIQTHLQAIATELREGDVTPGLDPTPTLRRAYLASRYVDWFLLFSREATPVAAAPALDEPLPAAVTRAVLDVVRDGRPRTTDLLRTTDGPWHAYVFIPVVGFDGRVHRVLGATLTPGRRRFAALTGSLHGYKLAPFLLTDSTGRVIAAAEDRHLLDTAAPAVLAGAVRTPVDQTPWTVWVVTPYVTRALEPGWRLFLGVPVLVALAWLFGWGVGRSVRRPLATLSTAADRVAQGDFTTPIPRVGNDEIGKLGRDFDRMRVSVHDLMEGLTAAKTDLERRVAERTRELAEANAALRERERLRVELLKKVIRAQEDERRRLARELHDETCQTVTALGVRLAMVSQSTDDPAARAEIDETRQLAARAEEEIRRLMHDLRPSVLDDLGLVSAIQWYAERQLGVHGIALRCELGTLPHRLAPEVETALFRVTQEAITNITKHARAERVLIQLGVDGDRLRVEIEDDGIGFDPADVTPSPTDARGLGLLGMRERVELLGGTLRIDAAPGLGTDLTIEVPLDAAGGGGGAS